MIQITFFGTLKNKETKTSQNGKEFTTGFIETVRKSKDGEVNSVWEVKCFGSVASTIRDLPIMSEVLCMGDLEMNSWEYQGKAYSKPQITVRAIGVVQNDGKGKGTTYKKTSFDNVGRAARNEAPGQLQGNFDDQSDLPF